MPRRASDKIQKRNEQIRKRYWELWEQGLRLDDVIIPKLADEFFLADATIKDIILTTKYDKYNQN
jgi:hypothetical protein